MEQLNLFTKGLKNTMDPTLFDNESWTFPTMNIRIINKEMQGFIVTYYDGATNNDTFFGEEFQLSEGFFIIGACQLNGVAYIFSRNSGGEGEIGCFPAPSISGTGTSEDFAGYTNNIVRKYSPLLNFSTNSSNRFRTPLFNFNGNIINCFARETYDGSVNIFFVDNYNVDRVINSGFNTEGFTTNRKYSAEDFNTIIPLQMVSPDDMPQIANVSVQTGGDLKFGNYFVFVRYVTDDFNKTKFLTQSRAIQVYDGHNSASDAQGGFFDKYSDKKISITFSVLNTSFKYYEIGVIRYYSDGNNPIQYETFLYDRYFETTNNVAEIVSNDKITPLTDGELFEATSKDVISKAIIQNENIAFKANITEKNKHDDRLAEFAKRVLLFTSTKKTDGYKIEQIDISDTEYNSLNLSHLMEHKDYRLTYDGASYFGGEIYAFGIVFGFNDGQETDVYPVRGINNVDGTIINETFYTDIDINPALSGVGENFNGIYRFPMRNVPGYNIYENNKVCHLNISFYFQQALDYIEANDNGWWDTIKYVRFVRADRKKLLLFQSLSMGLAYSNKLAFGQNTNECSYLMLSHSIPPAHLPFPPWHANAAFMQPNRTAFCKSWDGFWGQNVIGGVVAGPDTTSKMLHIPIYRGYVPRVWSDGEYTRNYVERMGLMYGRYALYSPDVFLSGNTFDEDKIAYLYPIAKTITWDGKTRYDSWQHKSKDTFFPIVLGAHGYNFPRMTHASVQGSYYQSDYGKKEVSCKFVGNVDNNTSDNPILLSGNELINDANDFSSVSGHLFYYKDGDNLGSNRALRTMPYIGAIVKNKATGEEEGFNHMNLNIVNAYSSDPFDIYGDAFENFYNIDTESYKEIGEIIPFSITRIIGNYALPFTDENWSLSLGGGDCFVQRTYFKQMSQKCSNIHLNPGGDTDYELGCEVMNDTSLDNPPSELRNVYNFGLIISIITENEVNTAMRNDDIITSKTYYPKNKDDVYWAIRPHTNQYIESFFMNHGYDQVLTGRQWILYNRLAPYNVTKRPTRIRHSAVYTPGSFYDGYRTWNADAFKDYDINEGEINALAVSNGILISIQRNTTNQHYTNQKQQRAEITTGEMIVGIGPILAQETRKLDFGTIHQNSVITTPNAIYGFDFIRRCIWRISLQTTQSGNAVLGQENLSLSKEINAWINTMIDSYYDKADTTRLLGDIPYVNLGVVAGYDPLYSEVYFTFLKDLTYNCSDTYVTSQLSSFVWNDKTLYTEFQICSYNGMFYYSSNSNTNQIPGISTAWIPFKQSDLTFVEQGSIIHVGEFVYTSCAEGSYGVISNLHCIYDPEGIAESDLPKIQSLNDLVVTIRKLPVNVLEIQCVCSNSRTIVFNEKTQHFLTEHDIKSYMYFNILSDTYSSTFVGIYGNTSNIFRHNQGDVLNIYQKQKTACISFVINGLSQQENTKVFNKIFQSIFINSGETPFYRVDYITDKQQSSIGFITGQYWSDPEYLENKWQLPVIIADSGNSEYPQESSLSGHYMIVTLYYNSKNYSYIKDILSNFNITFA